MKQMKQMKIMTVALLLLFSMNSEATLSKITACGYKNIAGSLYAISFEPYNAGDLTGRMELWMVFNNKGIMVPSKFWYAYDPTQGMTNHVTLFKSKAKTKLQLGTVTSYKAKGCYGITKITGRSYNEDESQYYAFSIEGEGIISRGNILQSDADYFTLTNSVITYGGNSYVGRLTFTQIR